MKILYYSGHPNLNLQDRTGYGTHMREVIKGFKNQGHEVEHFIVGGSEKENQLGPQNSSTLKEIIKKIIPKILWETLKDYRLIKKDIENEEKLIKIIEEFGPDLIYERGYYLIKSGSNVASEKKIKHYIEFNAPYIEERVAFSGKSLYLNKAKKVELDIIKKVNAIIVVSSPLKKYFSSLSDSINSKVLVTPNAINPSSIITNKENQLIIKKTLEIEDNFIFGFVGSILSYHGVNLLIEAFSKINKAHKNTKLLIVGNGNIIPQLKTLATKLNISKDVIFTGPVPHDIVFDYIDLMDVTVAAKAAWYNSPVKIFEYGFMGKAIIAPNYEAIKDVLEDKENSLLISPTVEEIAKAMNNLLENIQLRTKISRNIKEQVVREHTWDKVSKCILDFK